MTSTTYGVLEIEDGVGVVRFRRRLAHPLEKVWRALTEPAQLEAWSPTTIEGERVAGAALHFAFRHHEAPDFDGELLAFEPPTLLELRWGEDLLRFELTAASGQTVLDFTARMAQVGKAARDGAGWHACLDLLQCAVAGQAAPWSSPDRWREVRDAYVERFGPEASTMGPPPGWEEAHRPAEA